MFQRPNPYDEIVANATDENLTSENWDTILGVCEKVSRGPPEGARDIVQSIQKRLSSRNANVQLYSLTLIESLVKNCDKPVQREVSSRNFTNSLVKIVTDRTTHEKVRERILELVQQWSFEFRPDPTLGIMEETYNSLKAQDHKFPPPQRPKKEPTQTELDKQKEEEEFQLALALSLSETESRSQYKAPAPSTAKPAATAASSASNISRVRALYDFAPTESGELGFQKGDIIRVLENVYRDWWKGELRGKTGIFPVNYVEKIVDPTPAEIAKEAQMEAEVMAEARNVEQLLQSLASMDPRKDAVSDNEQLQELYNQTLSIRPKLVKLIEKYSQRKDELISLNEKFLRARTSYDKLMESSIARYSNTAAYNYQQPQQAVYGTPAPTADAHYATANPYSQQVGQPQVQQPQGYATYPAPTQIYQDHSDYAVTAAALAFAVAASTTTTGAAQQQQPAGYLPTNPAVAQQPFAPVNVATPPTSQTSAPFSPYIASMASQPPNTYSPYITSTVDQQSQQAYPYGYQPQPQDQAAQLASAAPAPVQPFGYSQVPVGQAGYTTSDAQGAQPQQQQQPQAYAQGY